MKHDYDQGTPELQAKRAQYAAEFADVVESGDQTKAGGLEFLHAMGTLSREQYHAGGYYAKWGSAYHRKHNIKCSLGMLSQSDGAQEPAGERHMWLASIMDDESWFSRVSSVLRMRSVKANRPYARIVLMVSMFGWSLQDVMREGAKYRKDGKPIHHNTASAWTRRAFDMLCDTIEEEEAAHKRALELAAR